MMTETPTRQYVAQHLGARACAFLDGECDCPDCVAEAVRAALRDILAELESGRHLDRVAAH